MPRRYFNWKLAVVLLIGTIVLGVTVYGLRQWRRGGRIERALEAGNKAYGEHNYDEAASRLGNYLAVMRNDVPVLLKYADAQLRIRPLKRNNIQQAIAAYRTILREQKQNSEAAKRLTELYLGIAMPGEAELIAKRYLENNHNPDLHGLLTLALVAQRKIDEAAKELKNIIDKYPEKILAYETLGQLTERQPENFSDPPQYWFNEAVKNNPSSALAYVILAAFNLRCQDTNNALTNLEMAENLDLSDSVVRLRFVKECINANLFDKAQKHLEAVQADDPDNLLLWQTWANLALKSKSKAEMLKVADNALKHLSYQSWDFMTIAAELYIKCDELERADDCIAKLRQKNIAPATIAFLEALLADRKGLSFEAVKYWYRAIQAGNKSTQVRLALAATLARSGDIQSALRNLRRLISEKPDLFEARIDLARLLVKNRRWAEAAEQARKAGEISPGSLNAALLQIQARINLLIETQADQTSSAWQDMESQLAALEKAAQNELPIKVLQFQLANSRSQFSRAQQVLNEMKNSFPARIEVDIAEVELLEAQENTDEAIRKLYDVVKEFPESTRPLKYLAALLAEKGQIQECEKTVHNALTRAKQPAVKSRLGLLLAGFYKRWNEQEKRYQLLDSLSREITGDILIIRELLKCEKVIKDFGFAQQLVDRIKAIEGEQGWQWRYEQARIWFAQDNFKNKYPQIISLLKENLLVNTDDQTSRMLLAAAYERAGQLQLAISNYRDALSRSPRDLNIIVPAVSALYKANEYDLADEILKRTASEKIFDPELKKLELQGCLRRGELSSAGDILEDLLSEDPDNYSVCLSLALLRMRQNKFAEADRLLSKLKGLDPNSMTVTVAQIELKVRQGKSDEALLLCDGIVNNLNNALAYILRARTFVSLDKLDKAEEDFEHATTIEPDNIEALVAKSDYCRSIGKLDQAIVDIRKALSIAPDNINIQKRVVSLLFESNTTQAVREGNVILDKALEANPEDAGLLLYKARLLLAEGNAPAIEKAVRILQQLIEDQPKISQAWVLLAEISLKQQQPGKAIDIALRGLSHTLNDKELLRLKARAEAQRSPTLAIPTLKLLMEMDPNDLDTAEILAEVYIEAGEPKKAIDLLTKQLISSNSTTEQRKLKIALLRALYKNEDKAGFQKELDSLFESEPNDPAPLITQVKLLKDDKLWSQLNRKVSDWNSSHPQDSRTLITIAGYLATSEDSQAKKIAEDLLRRVLDREPDSVPAMSSLAMLLQLTGRSLDSVGLYRRILSVQPDNVIALNNLAWIMCEEQGRHKEALQLVQRGLKTAPKYVDLIDTNGMVNYRLGEYEKAVNNFTKCINLCPAGTPSIVASYFHLGRALADLGRKSEAVKNLKKALELNAETGGLSTKDLLETQRLIEELSKRS